MHEAIHHERRTRHVPGPLQKCNRHEEQQNVRQKNQYTADPADDPLDHQPPEEFRLPRRPQRVDQIRQTFEKRLQPHHRIFPQDKGEEEHQIHHHQKNRQSEKTVGHHPVDHVGKLPPPVVTDLNRLPAGAGDHTVAVIGHQRLAVDTVAGGDFSAPLLRRLQQRRELRPVADFRIVLQQFDCEITRRNPSVFRAQKRFDRLGQSPDRLIGLRTVFRFDRPARSGIVGDAVNHFTQIIHSVSGRTDRLDDRSSKKGGEFLEINLQPALLCIVDHVEHQHHRKIQLRQLRRQIQIALRISGINHVQNQIDPAVHQFPERHAFFRRRRR